MQPEEMCPHGVFVAAQASAIIWGSSALPASVSAWAVSQASTLGLPV